MHLRATAYVLARIDSAIGESNFVVSFRPYHRFDTALEDNYLLEKCFTPPGSRVTLRSQGTQSSLLWLTVMLTSLPFCCLAIAISVVAPCYEHHVIGHDHRAFHNFLRVHDILIRSIASLLLIY